MKHNGNGKNAEGSSSLLLQRTGMVPRREPEPAPHKSQAYTSHFELMGRIRAGALTDQLGAFRHGDHFCSYYENPAGQLKIIVPYIKEAFSRGEAFLYVADDRTEKEINEALKAAGVDAEGVMSRGALTFVDKSRWRNPGDFDVEDMAAGVKRLAARCLEPGFSGLWIAVDMTWTLKPDIAPKDLARWESIWNELLRTLPVVLLCQYSLTKLPEETLHSELRTHPMVIVGDRICPNFFYEPPRIFLSADAHSPRLQWMFDQLQTASNLEEERQRIDQLKIDLISYASHQLKSPVAALIGYLENMMQGVAGPTSEKQLHYLKNMRKIAGDCLRLVSDFLNISKIEHGDMRVNVEHASLNEIVHAALNASAEMLREKGLELILQEESPHVPVIADVNKMVESVRNVFDNAVKFTDRGSITVRIRGDGAHGIVEISDTGIGIPMPMLEKLFTKQFILRETSPHGGSSGLGLYIAKQLVKLQNGDIEAASTPGKGSTFTIKIPAA